MIRNGQNRRLRGTMVAVVALLAWGGMTGSASATPLGDAREVFQIFTGRSIDSVISNLSESSYESGGNTYVSISGTIGSRNIFWNVVVDSSGKAQHSASYSSSSSSSSSSTIFENVTSEQFIANASYYLNLLEQVFRSAFASSTT